MKTCTVNVLGNCCDLLQIQLVEDLADTTSPDTPEAATSKMLKRGRKSVSCTSACNHFFYHEIVIISFYLFFSEIIEGPRSNKVVSEERDLNICSYIVSHTNSSGLLNRCLVLLCQTFTVYSGQELPTQTGKDYLTHLKKPPIIV